MFFVYILYSVRGNQYYIGQTFNIQQRLNQHNHRQVTSTAKFVPWDLILTLEKNSRSEALILERKLKNLNQEDLKAFIQKYSKWR